MAQKKKKSQGSSNRRANKHPPKREEEPLTGVISMHSRGFGFVTIDQPTIYTQDIFIPRHLTNNAVHGDKVEVIVSSEVSNKGPEGRVSAIIERGRTHIAGVIEQVRGYKGATAYVPLLGEEHKVIVEPSEEFALTRGDRVILEVLDWGKEGEPHSARVSHLIGHITDQSIDIDAAIEEFDLRKDFPIEVIEEAQKFDREVTPHDLRGRVDYRECISLTIDPDTAKDFDDAISVIKSDSGYELIVHIADVSHYVPAGSLLDQEAYLRCNSTYFPGRCIPMLPEELSNELCSLKPNVDRLTISAHMHFDKKGQMHKYSIHRSVIKSAHRFTYKQALSVLEGHTSSPFAKHLKTMRELCQLLKNQRKERGSVEFAVSELSIQVDNEGFPTGFERIEYDITHQMIEEFMLKANQLVAEHLTEQGKGLTYRVHDQPDEANIEQFVKMAAAFGFKISSNPTPQELQQLFETTHDNPLGPFLVTSYIRSMKLAAYSADNIGHFGLSLAHYCHFTSPIRRYVDLVVHRILLGEERDDLSLDDVAKRASERERISAKAEMNVKLMKKLRYLKWIDDEEPYKTYDAVIVRVKQFGIFAEILGFELEAFISLSELSQDYYNYDEAKQRLVGERSGSVLAVGDPIRLHLKEVDLVRLEAKWYLALEKKKPRKKR